jgi:cysteine desulfurase
VTPRVHLDWNAGAPLRREARAAMAAAMDLRGNPSSVHAEGRAARAALERARSQVAALAGCEPDRVAFTSGATEAAALAASNLPPLSGGAVEHPCVAAWLRALLPVGPDGVVDVAAAGAGAALALQVANSETGVIQPPAARPVALSDAAQAAGRIGWTAPRYGYAMLSSVKLGGPAGVGALIVPTGTDPAPLAPGGGQERGRRPGTENLIGAAGFGAAAEAALASLRMGVWDSVAALRDKLSARLRDAAPDALIVGAAAARLPNTLCLVVPGWPGETQVMAMDIDGYAISAGMACSSGKVGESPALRAMGLAPEAARCAIRVSIGPDATETAIDGFVLAWTRAYARRRARARAA